MALLALPASAGRCLRPRVVVCAPAIPAPPSRSNPATSRNHPYGFGFRGGRALGSLLRDRESGLARLLQPDATLALVPLPLSLAQRARRSSSPTFRPCNRAAKRSNRGAWLAAKGAVTGPAGLVNFELMSLAGNTPRFVRGLRRWGRGETLPADIQIASSRERCSRACAWGGRRRRRSRCSSIAPRPPASHPALGCQVRGGHALPATPARREPPAGGQAESAPCGDAPVGDNSPTGAKLWPARASRFVPADLECTRRLGDRARSGAASPRPCASR